MHRNWAEEKIIEAQMNGFYDVIMAHLSVPFILQHQQEVKPMGLNG